MPTKKSTKPKRKMVLRKKDTKPKRKMVLRKKDKYKFLTVAKARQLLKDLRKDRNPRGYWRMKKADLIKEAGKFKYKFVKGKNGAELRPTGTGMRRQRVYK